MLLINPLFGGDMGGGEDLLDSAGDEYRPYGVDHEQCQKRDDESFQTKRYAKKEIRNISRTDSLDSYLPCLRILSRHSTTIPRCFLASSTTVPFLLIHATAHLTTGWAIHITKVLVGNLVQLSAQSS